MGIHHFRSVGVRDVNMMVAGGKMYALSISMNATLRILDGKTAEAFWAYLSMNLSTFRAGIFCIPKREKHGKKSQPYLNQIPQRQQLKSWPQCAITGTNLLAGLFGTNLRRFQDRHCVLG